MSCHLRTTAQIQGVTELRTFFFPHLEKAEQHDDDDDADDGWGDSKWGWEATENKENVTADAINSWILDCHVGASPMGDHVAFGFDDKLAVLQARYLGQQDSFLEENCATLVVAFKDVIVKPQLGHLRDAGAAAPPERISCVACVPIASQKRTSLSGAPDWTAIVVGFTSGSIKFYTEAGVLLLSQIFHEGERVETIKCFTGTNIKQPVPMQEELTIQYSGGIVVSIEGFGLVQTLRACRNQAARVSASGSSDSDALYGASTMPSPPPLAYRKWSLKSQETVVSHVSTGYGTTCAFDQLQTASAFLGNRHFRVSPGASSGYLATGAGPFVAFYYAKEGATHSLMTEVSTFVSTKLTSMFSGASSWFGLGKAESPTKQEANQPKREAPTPLNISHALPDMRRHGESVVLAPSLGSAAVDSGHGRHLAATTDSFGRVILIDVARKVAIRIWKGYRDAQLGFLQVMEQESTSERGASDLLNLASPSPRMATFLVIYAPRRGILEVWTMEQGPRVGAFNVNKWCRLLYPGHEILGSSAKDASSSSSSKRRQRLESLSASHRSRLQFIDPDGAVKVIQVPFHLALTSKNSRRAEDLHLLKTFKIMLRDHRPAHDQGHHLYPATSSHLDKEIKVVLSSIKSHSVRQQALERLLQTPYIGPEAMLRYCNTVQTDLLAPKPTNSEDETSKNLILALDVDAKLLLRYCKLKVQLLEVYLKLLQKESSQEETPLPQTDHPSISFQDSLHLSQLEQSVIPQLLHLAGRTMNPADPTPDAAPRTQSVQFSDSKNAGRPRVVSVCSFLASFDIHHHRRNDESHEESRLDDDVDSPLSIISPHSTSDPLPVTVIADKKEPRFHKVASLLFSSEFDRISADFQTTLRNSGIKPEFLLDMLLSAWLRCPNIFSLRSHHLTHFSQLLVTITRLDPGLEQVLVDPTGDALSPWWCRMRETCAEATSPHIPSAFLACLVARARAAEVTREAKQEKLEDSCEENPQGQGDLEEEEAGWVAINRETEAWNLLIKRLEDCLSLAVLMSFRPAAGKGSLKKENADEDPPEGLSVNHILKAGRGGIPEVVARWVARREVTADQLSDRRAINRQASLAVHVEEKKRDSDVEGVGVGDYDDVLTAKATLSRIVRPRLVNSLKWDVLAANCCWEFAVLWNKFVDGQLSQPPEILHAHLRHSLEFLRTIENAVLAHGVAVLLWQTFLSKKMEALTTMMEKVKKAPKDRLCRQGLGPELSHKAVAQLLPLTHALLDILLDTNMESSSSMDRESDPAWHTCEGHAPLVELALVQKSSHAPNVAHHLLLLTIMDACFVFQTKSVKLLTGLFDSRAQKAFFTELHVKPPGLSMTSASSAADSSRRGATLDTRILETREQWLCKILTTAGEHLFWIRNRPASEGNQVMGGHEVIRCHEVVKVEDADDVVPLQNSDPSATSAPATCLNPELRGEQVQEWIGRILGVGDTNLARDLSIDVDFLRRHLVCEFYSNGMDEQGEQILLTVNDRSSVGSQLLLIAGQRIACHLLAGTDSKLAAKQCDELSLLPAALAKWIKTLTWSVLRYPQVPMNLTAVLVGHVINCLPEDHSDFKTALSLVETVHQLSE